MCSDRWDETTVSLVCRKLGYNHYITNTNDMNYGVESGSVWLLDVKCEDKGRNNLSCSACTRGKYSIDYCDNATLQCYGKFLLA